ncbi:MAG TPA: hypothetical protein VMC84_06575 [Methanocella sp.]|uniref:hypothetical protein n=1 Tax=Methanocella sp. TaxID=2052833 RepID=UPI002C33F05A|nr:hypothetical protein [Methanocella sp.]HTY90825.1 hypothetical protein [Methanocella sp.]
MKRYSILFALSVLIASLLVAGCTGSPVSTPAVTATPNPSAIVSAVPTLIGNSDEAHIEFYYQLGKMAEYDGQKASPGMLFYPLQVKVSSDKPVQTSPDWFGVEYKVNDTDPVQTRQPFSTYMFTYPTRELSSDTGAARGGIIFELPANLAEGYPKPYYYMPLDQQQGPYKVYNKVYGVVGATN